MDNWMCGPTAENHHQIRMQLRYEFTGISFAVWSATCAISRASKWAIFPKALKSHGNFVSGKQQTPEQHMEALSHLADQHLCLNSQQVYQVSGYFVTGYKKNRAQL